MTSNGCPLNVTMAWQGAVKRAGLEDFQCHALRHTAASYLAISGACFPEIVEILGHKTTIMVKRYSHFSASHTASVVERIVQQMFTGRRDE